MCKRKWHHSTKSCHKHTGNRWAPNAFQMGSDSELQAVRRLSQQKDLWGTTGRPEHQPVGTAAVKHVCRTGRDSERLGVSKRRCGFFLQPFDEWWVAAGSECSHCSWSEFAASHRKFQHVIWMHVCGACTVLTQLSLDVVFIMFTTRCWIRLVSHSWRGLQRTRPRSAEARCAGEAERRHRSNTMYPFRKRFSAVVLCGADDWQETPGSHVISPQGTCVNLNTLDRVSPLHGACIQGHVTCAKLLMENGANVSEATFSCLFAVVKMAQAQTIPKVDRLVVFSLKGKTWLSAWVAEFNLAVRD